MWIKAAILLLLIAVFVQDMRERSVYWFLFPLLASALFFNRMSVQRFGDLWPPVMTNICFLGIQLLLVSAWFSLRNGKWTNITTSLLGWGDILFLACIAFGLPVFSFLAFYLVSLTAIAICWAVLRGIRRVGDIPLAGLQALLLAFVLSGDWWVFHADITNDEWMLKLITL